MSFRTPGWRPVSSTILAAPSTVCAASCCAMSRGRPACRTCQSVTFCTAWLTWLQIGVSRSALEREIEHRLCCG